MIKNILSGKKKVAIVNPIGTTIVAHQLIALNLKSCRVSATPKFKGFEDNKHTYLHQSIIIGEINKYDFYYQTDDNSYLPREVCLDWVLTNVLNNDVSPIQACG